MSQPAVAALARLPFELVYDDGEPLDSNWHRIQMNLLIDVIRQAMVERGRIDVFVGGNMFVYYSYEQARSIAANPADRRWFRGPDVFYVDGVESRRERRAWVVWEEGGRYPDVIVELLSPSTAKTDRTVKKDLYARTFRTPEYYLYDPETEALEGFQLAGDAYRPLVPDAQGRLWSERLELAFGRWRGVQAGEEATWVRLFHADGGLAPTRAESAEARAESAEARAEAAEARAEAERQRARAAEARTAALETELERLRSRPGERSGPG